MRAPSVEMKGLWYDGKQNDLCRIAPFLQEAARVMARCFCALNSVADNQTWTARGYANSPQRVRSRTASRRVLWIFQHLGLLVFKKAMPTKFGGKNAGRYD